MTGPQLVGQTKAVLLVQNYQRLLNMMQACNLVPQHYAALIAGLDASAKLGVPLAWRRNTFRALLQRALWPLGQLLWKKDNSKSVFAKHSTHNYKSCSCGYKDCHRSFPIMKCVSV